MSVSQVSNLPHLPYPDMNSSGKEWDDYFKRVVLARLFACLAAHQLFKASMLVETSLLPFLQNFTEIYLIGSQAKIEKIAAEILKKLNKIQDDFNKMKDATGDEKEALAKDALEQYYGKGGIKELLEKNKSLFPQDFIDGITDKFEGGGAIFGKDVHGVQDFAALSKYWDNAWHPPAPVPPKPTGDSVSVRDGDESGTLEVIENGLNDVNNALNSQNSTVQARIKFYESRDEQIEAMIHNWGQQWVDFEKQTINAVASGG